MYASAHPSYFLPLLVTGMVYSVLVISDEIVGHRRILSRSNGQSLQFLLLTHAGFLLVAFARCFLVDRAWWTGEGDGGSHLQEVQKIVTLAVLIMLARIERMWLLKRKLDGTETW